MYYLFPSLSRCHSEPLLQIRTEREAFWNSCKNLGLRNEPTSDNPVLPSTECPVFFHTTKSKLCIRRTPCILRLSRLSLPTDRLHLMSYRSWLSCFSRCLFVALRREKPRKVDYFLFELVKNLSTTTVPSILEKRSCLLYHMTVKLILKFELLYSFTNTGTNKTCYAAT